jgi:hypothetical protein
MSVLNDYSLVVRDREGNIMPLSKEGRRKVAESRLISYKPPVILHPGKQLIRDLVITDIYDFRPGNGYTITVYRILERGCKLDCGLALPYRFERRVG